MSRKTKPVKTHNWRPPERYKHPETGEILMVGGRRDDVRLTTCTGCGRYGLVDEKYRRCVCEGQSAAEARRGYGCRVLTCKRIQKARRKKARR